MDRVTHGEIPRIALVDLDLPGMSGLEFIHRLEKLDPTVFPVLITASSNDRLANLLCDEGVTYMRKPLDFPRLLNILSERIGQR